MGFFSNLFGTNQKYSVGRVGSEYDKAYEPARDAYSDLMGRGREMMDPNSALNQAEKARQMAQGQDASAEAARMAQRTAAMSGGAPAGVMAAQARAGSNKAQEASLNSYNQYLQGAMSGGAGMLSGAANNLASMNTNKMNAMAAQRQANAQLDSQAAGATASLAGSALGMVGTAMGGPLGGMVGSALGGLFGQEGGSVPEDLYMQKGGEVFKPHMMYKGDKEEMANKFIDHIRLKNQGYTHKKGMAYGGMVKKYAYGGMVDARDNIAGLTQGLIRDKKEGEDDKTEKIGMLMKLAPMAMGAPPVPMQKGGKVYGQEGGMLSQVMGPKGPMAIGTRMGGVQIG